MRTVGDRFERSARVAAALAATASLVVAACDSRDSTAPELMGVDPHVATGTLVASGSGLLQAAAARGDSTGVAVFVARIEARGHPGDSVVLRMSGDAPTLEVLAKQAEFTVRSWAGEQRVAADRALDGVAILRLEGNSSQTFEIWMKRSLPSILAPSTFQLRLDGTATVAVVRAGWLERTPASERSAHLLDPTTCDVIGATGTCGGVSWTVSPHYIGNPFCGATCFQSDPTTGQSLPVTISFSQPVASVTATIMDPTWDGNTIAAIAFDGSTIEQKTFAFSGVPHQNFPDTKSVSGVVDRILLQPAENEYVAYVVTFVPLEARISLTCASVARGQNATCTAAPTAPGITLIPTAWQFRDAVGNIVDRTVAVSSTTWAGTVAKSGTIRINGTVDGVSTFGMTSLTVTARSWSGKVAPKAHSVIPTTLPSAPDSLSQLGRAGLSLPTDPNVSSWLRTISDKGPNHEFSYLAEIPIMVTTVSQVNTNAINGTSPFYQVQESRRKKIGDLWYCPKSLVTGALFGIVQAHEGAIPDPSSLPNSHPGIFRRHVDSLAYLRFEGVVGFRDEDQVSPVSDLLFESAATDSKAMDSDSRNNITNVSLGCDTFRFTY